MALDLNVGDEVRMRKVHPCGGYLWRVTRLGADIGLHCLRCRRHVMLPRPYLERRVREVVRRAPAEGEIVPEMGRTEGRQPGGSG